MTGRLERRRKQVLDDRKERRGHCKLKEEALWRTRFGRGHGPVLRQITGRKNLILISFKLLE